MTLRKEKAKWDFRTRFLRHVEVLNLAVLTQRGDRVVKGLIDIAKSVYPISVDTKVVSKSAGEVNGMILGALNGYSWMYYVAKDMAKAVDLERPPYRNLTEYRAYKGLGQ